MKPKDVAEMHGLDKDLFEKFIEASAYRKEYGAFGDVLIDKRENVEKIVADFRQHEAEKEAVEAEKNAVLSEKNAVLAEILITSGFNFDGYTITKYSGYISGDDAVSVDRGWAFFGIGLDIKDKLLGSLVEIRRNALTELKEAAHALGCNAVIGVDFDYLTLDPQTANLRGGTTYMPYIFCVTANGNAVIIEKNDQ